MIAWYFAFLCIVPMDMTVIMHMSVCTTKLVVFVQGPATSCGVKSDVYSFLVYCGRGCCVCVYVCMYVCACNEADGVSSLCLLKSLEGVVSRRRGPFAGRRAVDQCLGSTCSQLAHQSRDITRSRVSSL